MITSNEHDRLRQETTALILSAKAELLAYSARRDIDRLRLRLAELRLEHRLRAFRERLSARAYNPNQPREPAGIPTGGRWTIGGGISLAPDVDETAGEGLQERATTMCPWNSTDTSHSSPRRGGSSRTPKRVRYCRVPIEMETVIQPTIVLFTRSIDVSLLYMEQHPNALTPEQVRAFTQQILGSRDPRIQDFNLRIWRREIRLWILRAPRGE